MSSTSSPTRTDEGPPTETKVPEVLEWLVGALLGLGGLSMLLGGSAVLWAIDENLIAPAIAEGFADGSIDPDLVSPAEATVIATNTAFWLGIGLLVTGLAVVAVAIIYVVARHRTRRADGHGSDRERLFSSAILGAVVTGLLSMVPISPILGGGVAGYLSRADDSPLKAGALSGLLAALPLVLIVLFSLVGLLAGFSSVEAGLGVVVALAVAIGVVGTLLYFVGFGAIGGYVASVIAEDEGGPAEPDEQRHETDPPRP